MGSKKTINTEYITFERKGLTRLININRPDALNALSIGMIRTLTAQLQVYEQSNACLSMIIRGDNSYTKRPAFCSGGDVVALAKETEPGTLRRDFFAEEYCLNHYIGSLKKPYIAFMDGITMGGGVGISIHAPFRVATERTIFAMPETAIGYFPDVGGSFFLPRLGGSFGTFLGLTGHQLRGVDAYYAGIATHFIPSHRLDDVIDRISVLESNDFSVVANTLNEFSEAKEEFSLNPLVKTINECFGGNNIQSILNSLQQKALDRNPIISDWAISTKKTLLEASPTSLVMTLEAQKKGLKNGFKDAFSMEFGLSQAFMADKDFNQGVRAKLIEKTGNPQWDPKALDEILPSKVTEYFTVPKSNMTFIAEENYTSYPYQFGLPSEYEIVKILKSDNFKSKQQFLDYLSRLIFKAGWQFHVRNILDRISTESNGKLQLN